MKSSSPGFTPSESDPHALTHSGFVKLPGIFSSEQIADARALIAANADLLYQTRSTPNSLHLAGFHRYPELEPLHELLTQNYQITKLLSEVAGGGIRTIGLSDITIDRSQEWHKDLLRGSFSQHISSNFPCRDHSGTAYKVILYLQTSSTLKISEGSHKIDVNLEDDTFAIPEDPSTVQQVSTEIGDVVILDICLSHRGSEESAVLQPREWNDKRILVSTVFGRDGATLTNQMELGNAFRLNDWVTRNSDRQRGGPLP
jgi:hypothetical protein